MNTPSLPPPCRGCLPDCPNRSRCQGKPWRTLDTASAGAVKPSTTR